VAEFESYVTAVRRRVVAAPASVAVRFRETVSEDVLDYAGLDTAAALTAGWLAARLDLGDRVLLSFSPGSAFVKAFLGCLYAGVVPVPVPPPGPGQAERTAGVAADAQARLVLTDARSRAAVSAVLAEVGLDTPVHGFEDLEPDGDRAGFEPPEVTPETLAFLQYTSGSTSDPKGVMVTHGALLHNIRLMCESHGWDRESVFCSWLPVYHDMGLIAMTLTPLYLGATAVLLAPNDFLKRPATWLRLIDEHRATVSCAPNFAYELCARRLSDDQIAGLDLTSWTHACNGAEPVDAATLELFAERFAPAGFRAEALLPGYGLAESTLYVSGTRVESPPVVSVVDAGEFDRGVFTAARRDRPARALVSSGIVRGLDVRIVAPDTRAELADGLVGEIWIRGDSVAAGYWRRPEETAGCFGAVTAAGDGGFLRTGDLGVRYGGELYVTGRAKEMFVVHGRNLYPQDVERELRAVDPAFGDLRSAAFSITVDPVVPGSEEIVVVQELRARGRAAGELAGLSHRAKTGLSRRLGVRVANVVFVRVGRVRRTTSGKVRRVLMRELFVTGMLEALWEDLDDAVRARYRPSLTTAGEPR
jgi:acyl-CoA synthetase (AMP-forming)/AMP-acid ligase II